MTQQSKLLAKEKIEELQKCANRHRDMHKARMQVEYHVLVTALSFYAAATWAVVQQATLGLPTRVAISVGFIALSSFASALLKRLHVANQVNIAISENYEAEIVKLPEPQTNPIPERLQGRDYHHVRSVPFLVSNWGFQSATIVGFSLVGIILIRTK